MTHVEIILWIQEKVIGIIQKMNEKYTISYIDDDGMPIDIVCDSLIQGVLAVNGKELVL